jgi:hypothetical protein
MSDGERIARLEQIVENQTKILDEISTNVLSLLESRSFYRGALWLAGGISAAVSLFIGWLKA